jgi:hypothetical protein
MTFDERTQLLEDIKKSNRMRAEIAERAEADKEFDIVAAWEMVDDIDASIRQRIVDGQPND